MTPVHFTALGMVDISYSLDAKHHCRHAASEMNVRGGDIGTAEKWKRKRNEVEHEVRWTAAK